MSDKARTLIIDKVKTRINTYFGPSGSEESLFKKVRRDSVAFTRNAPMCRVNDGGQRSAGPNTNESSVRTLKIRIFLQLKGDWGRDNDNQVWSDNVERIIHLLENWTPPGCGVTDMKYVNDDPFDMVFVESGDSQATWVIEFEADYFVEAEAKGNWTPE